MKKRFQWKTTQKATAYATAIDDKPNDHYKNKRIFTYTILFVFDRYITFGKKLFQF